MSCSMSTMPTSPIPAGFPAADDEALQALQGAVNVLAAKWSVVVLARLAAGTQRFNELLRQIDGVSRRMLSAALRPRERFDRLQRWRAESEELQARSQAARRIV